jgi:hypothetical protein
MEGYKVVNPGILSNFEHLQNVWHYFMDHGCFSYSPLHFASAFKTLVIVPIPKRKGGYNYTIYYALSLRKDRKPVEKIPEDSHYHDWFKDTVLHDPMELLGSYKDGKDKITESYVCKSSIECNRSYTLEEFEKLRI